MGQRENRLLSERTLSVLLGATAVLVLVAWAVLAARHMDDRFQVDHVGGSRMALAAWADRGTLYPPLNDGEHYGGSRFMPLPILLHTAFAKATGEYLTSGKVASALSMAALLVLVFLALRRVGVARLPAGALTAGVLATQIGFEQGTGITGDALPAALQLGAVLLVSRSERGRTLMVAAALCALALFAKLSALWAPMAIGAWFLVRDRRKLAAFAGSYAAVTAVLFIAFQVATDGRLLENISAVSLAGLSGAGSLVRPARILPLLAVAGVAVFALVPLAALEVGRQVRARRLDLFVVTLLAAVMVTVVVFTAVGTNYNHLLDMVALTVVVTGALWVRAAPAGEGFPPVRLLVTLALLWGVAASVLTAAVFRGEQRTGAASPVAGRRPLARFLEPGDRILSADPGVPVAYGQLPVVLDPFMFLRLGQEHPEWVEDLVARIEAREFDTIVLLFHVREPDLPNWYRVFQFGPPVAQAIDRAYRPVAEEGPYLIYQPR